MKILLKNGIFILLLILFFENLLLKIEPSEITPVFYNNFFRFRGRGNFPFSPWLRPWLLHICRDDFKIPRTRFQGFVRNSFVKDKCFRCTKIDYNCNFGIYLNCARASSSNPPKLLNFLHSQWWNLRFPLKPYHFLKLFSEVGWDLLSLNSCKKVIKCVEILWRAAFRFRRCWHFICLFYYKCV